jgi:hypothetical protein
MVYLLPVIVRTCPGCLLLFLAQYPIENLQSGKIQARKHVLPGPFDLVLRAQPLKLLPACTLALPIASVATPTFSPTHTHTVLHCAQNLRASLTLHLLRMNGLLSAYTRGLLVFERNKFGGDLVRGRVLVATNRDRGANATPAASFVVVVGADSPFS